MAYAKVSITGNSNIFSVGPKGRVQRQTLALSRTPDGTLYLDNNGTVCTEFKPEAGTIQSKNAVGYGIKLTRKVDNVVDVQP